MMCQLPSHFFSHNCTEPNQKFSWTKQNNTATAITIFYTLLRVDVSYRNDFIVDSAVLSLFYFVDIVVW